MATKHIMITLDTPIMTGRSLTFRTPTNCSDIQGLSIKCVIGGGVATHLFKFADAHGNDLSGSDVFKSGILVKVILDLQTQRAYIQNADTNSYLEDRLNSKLSKENGVIAEPIVLKKGLHYGDTYPENAQVGQLFLISLEAVNS